MVEKRRRRCPGADQKDARRSSSSCGGWWMLSDITSTLSCRRSICKGRAGQIHTLRLHLPLFFHSKGVPPPCELPSARRRRRRRQTVCARRQRERARRAGRRRRPGVCMITSNGYKLMVTECLLPFALITSVSCATNMSSNCG